MNIDTSEFKVNESKQKWSVILGNLTLALLAILQTISVFIQKSNYELLYVAFAFPGFYYYITHKHNIGLGKAILICLGFNRNFEAIKGFLIGAFGGFFIGWYLMYMNLYHFLLKKCHVAKARIEQRKTKGKDKREELREENESTSHEKKDDESRKMSDVEETEESLSLHSFTEVEDEERKVLLKSERPLRERR
ncbi:hypothetical protein [Brevibacillus reuszeri]|uniref:hypothetical protein n=1 Tax=Brevibacillus reuszeri TaxID=54915 RepID=UPI003D21C546